MISDKSINKCCGCSACSNVCPQKCIQLKRDTKGLLRPSIDKSKCVSCGLCEKVCPFEFTPGGSTNVYANKNIMSFYCMAKDNLLREGSSSGGVFPILAESVIENGGKVYAACFGDNFYDVQHVCIDNCLEISKACGAKYIQSDLKYCFKDIKKDLENNETILFVGTPCQVYGLKLFLRKSYKSLYTVDMICHGIPGNMYWKKYLDYRNKKNKTIKNISFRDKRRGWLHYGISIEYQDGSSFFLNHNRDPYMLAYLNNYLLSETCFECRFRGANRHSDITIGDAWGINYVSPQLFDDRGLSVVLTHTVEGERLLRQVGDKIIIKKANYEDIKKYNLSVEVAAIRPKEYEQFNRDCTSLTTDSLIKKYFYFNPIVRIKDFAKELLYKK